MRKTIQAKKASIRRSVDVPLDQGVATFFTFNNLSDPGEHLALVFKSKNQDLPPLVRIHSECLTGDVFQSARCDCGDQLKEAISEMNREGGILIYLRQEGRGIGLYNKLDAYEKQDQGFDTYEANRLIGKADDLRDYGVAVEMLRALGINRVRLLTNNPKKIESMNQLGIEVVERVGTGVYLKDANRNYLRAKALTTHHMLGNLNFLEEKSPAPRII